MRSFSIICFLSFILSGCFSEPEKLNAESPNSRIAQITDAYFTALTDLKKFNGVVLVFDRDSVIFEKAYTIYPHPDSASYVSLNHQFDIHSISKLMARALVTKLESQHRLSPDRSLYNFFPDFPRGEEITVDMLLENRSGLPRELLNFQGKESHLSPEEIVEAAKNQVLLFEPGSDEQYSNIGYELVYRIIAKSYDKSFAQCVIDEIFIPLQMHESGAWFYSDRGKPERIARNHILRDSLMVQVPQIAADEFKTARIYSTVTDLHRFLQWLLSEPYASSLKNEEGIITKDGGSRGVRAKVYADTETGRGYVVLANYDEMPFFDTADDMARILRSDTVDIPRPVNRRAITLPDTVMKRYEGRYVFADFDGLVLRVVPQGDTLGLYEGEKKIGNLRAESETVFFENPNERESFEFVPTDTGTYKVLMGWKGIVVEGVPQ